MIGEETYFLKKYPREVEIHGKFVTTYPLTLNNLIDQELEKSLSNMEGRLLSTKRVYNIKKLTPIYLSQGLILQPLASYDTWDLIMVNMAKVKSFTPLDVGTLIVFDDGYYLEVSVGINKLKKYLNNCKAVLLGQLQIERKYIYYGKKDN